MNIYVYILHIVQHHCPVSGGLYGLHGGHGGGISSKDAIRFQVGMTGMACATLSGQTEMMQDGMGRLEVPETHHGPENHGLINANYESDII